MDRVIEHEFFGVIWRVWRTRLESKAETEVKRAEIFARLAIRIPSVIETDRADRQFVTQAGAETVTHVVHARLFGSGKKVAGIEEERALKLTINRKGVFHIKDREKF